MADERDEVDERIDSWVSGIPDLDLEVEGIVGPLTWHALQTLEPTAPVVPKQKPVLEPEPIA